MDDGSVLLFSRGFGPLFLVLLHRRRVGGVGAPGTNVLALIPDLQDDSRERGTGGEGREETLELRENRDRSRATGTRGTGIEKRRRKRGLGK